MGSIAVIGVDDVSGPLAGATLERLRAATHVVVSSADGPLAGAIAEAGLHPVSLEELGLSPESPSECVVEVLVDLAQGGDVAYASAGYPLLKQGLLTGLLSRTRAAVDVFPVLSPLQIILMAFDIDLTADLDIVDARSLAPVIGQRDSHLVVTGVRNAMLARRAEKQLGVVYPPDHPVVAAGCLSGGGYALALTTVAELGDFEVCDDAAVYVAPSRMDPPGGFVGFVRTIAVLRSPEGCPWDRAQTHLSLRRNMIEEAYEAVGAIESADDDHLAEELGDVLLQVVLHAQIAADEGRFTIDDVVAGIAEKIRRRHPHVFGSAVAGTPDEVIETWDAIKRDEKAQGGTLDGIPANLPALMWAQKISRRAVGVGFEWESLDAVWEKVHEEIDELKETQPGSPEAAEEIGDLLFTVVNLARKQGIDAEEALRATCRKFIGRFEDMERTATGAGSSIADIDITEMERLWRDAKGREGSQS